MNSIITRTVALVATSSLCLQIGFRLVQAAENATEADFPYVIPHEFGTSGFSAGDRIAITTVRGDRKRLEPDGSYLVQGTYTLASVESAIILFSCTSRGPSGPTPIVDGQDMQATRGSGTFSLRHKNACDGWLHVSFYVAGEGRSRGGIYFGEKGSEKTVLRKAGWFDLPDGAAGEKRAEASDPARNGEPRSSGELNGAIMAYLGNPVPAPAGLDAKYTPTKLAAAFVAMSERAAWRVRHVAVDSSEFPFIVYGVIEGRQRLAEEVIRETKGYDYGGSVVGTTEQGSTYFALNMIPHSQYPKGQIEACNRRLMVRLQMLAGTAQHWR